MPADAAGAERAGGWRLATSTSEYLRSASEQSIDWHPWGEEAFELAKRTQKPILLDIGAAWCHWCHVMDEGTYSDLEVARLVNQFFVAVKVDRDQNPEVDRRFQRQVSALTGEGGWPLTAFLTPAGEVFLGGTYFPAVDGLGRPGFRRVLREVARLWKDEPEKIRRQSASLVEALGRIEKPRAPEPTAPGVFLGAVRAELFQSYDPIHGGFGFAPKFPHPTAIAFLLWSAYATDEPSTAEKARASLGRMADGGIYDHVGGGFHRYATDEGWHIPHFEKMSADNAALLAAYVEGWRRFVDARLEETARGVLAWVGELMTDPQGGFAASQDADNAPGDDGSYFTWSRAELKGALDAPALRLVTRSFGIGSDGRMPHDPDRNVLYRLMDLPEAAEGTGLSDGDAARVLRESLAKLKAERDRRPRPKVDRALYANLNGMYIRAFAAAGSAFGDAALLASARRAADRFLAHAYEPARGVAHRLDGSDGVGYGLLEDQVEFAYGLVELAGATAEPRYARAAAELLELVLKEFGSEDAPLRDLAPSIYDGPVVGGLTDPTYPVDDNPHLSANAAALLALVRLGSLTQEERWTMAARKLADSVRRRIASPGLFASGTALAIGLLDTPPARVVVEGRGDAAARLLASARRAWHPNVWVFAGVPPTPFSLPDELAAATGRDEPRALVCFGTRCLPPITEPEALAPQLGSIRPPSGA